MTAEPDNTLIFNILLQIQADLSDLNREVAGNSVQIAMLGRNYSVPSPPAKGERVEGVSL